MPDRERPVMDDRIRRHQQLRDKLNSHNVPPDGRSDRPLGSGDGDSDTVVLDDIEPDTLVIPRASPSAKPLIAPPPITLPVPPPPRSMPGPDRRWARLALAIVAAVGVLAFAAALLLQR